MNIEERGGGPDVSQKGLKILSDLSIYSKYAKYIPEKSRREDWIELCDRYESMLVNKYYFLRNEIRKYMQLVRDKKILPSMRALQFAGVAIERNESRIYNCAYLPIDHYKAFSEAMFLLLGGIGVGYSVQYHHVDQLPIINPIFKYRNLSETKYLVSDSIEGWADAIKALMKAYFGFSTTRPRFDFSDIREKGTRLVTSGGKAPGPFPLRYCLFNIQEILDRKESGERLTPLECHDILCFIAEAVKSGGIRRAAMISLFSFDDEEMRTCKSGDWFLENRQRALSNNSAVILRSKIKKNEFRKFWRTIEESGSGEPGSYFTNDKDWGANPCCEIALRPFQFCNLTEINGSKIKNQDDFILATTAAAYFATLQASFTDFHYLRPIWKRTTEKEALIGVGITGIVSLPKDIDLKKAAKTVKEINQKYSKIIGINSAARSTTVKPSGTTSCVLGTASGIHSWYNRYYIRRMKFGKGEEVYKYMKKTNPHLVEDDLSDNKHAFIKIPIHAPEDSPTRNEDLFEFLERITKFNVEWIQYGHTSGVNTNNVSATVYLDSEKLYNIEYVKKQLRLPGIVDLKPDYIDENNIEYYNEWSVVGEWVWNNKHLFNGMSFFPTFNGTFSQTPFEDISEEEFYRLTNKINNINLNDVIEEDDNTNLAGEAACAGGSCEI